MKHRCTWLGTAALLALLSACQTPNRPADKDLDSLDRTVPDYEAVIELEVARRVSDRPAPPLPKIELGAPQLVPLPEALKAAKFSQGASATPLPQIMGELEKANDAATRNPTPDGFVNAIHFYDYAPGVRYNVIGAVGFLTAIQLQPGEQMLSLSAGDTEHFRIDPVTVGAGDKTQQIILVKPLKSKVSTNFVITTDKRAYFVDVLANDKPNYQSAIAWHYPLDSYVRYYHRADERRRQKAETLSADFDLDRLNFGYRLLYQEKGADGKVSDADPPFWSPLRVFDDGAKTYIQFPESARHTELPPLFVLPHPNSNEAQVVNYRKRGNYYIADRLFAAAELRVGESPQQIVRIERQRPIDPWREVSRPLNDEKSAAHDQ